MSALWGGQDMKVWYCQADGVIGGYLIAAPTRGKAKVLATRHMMLQDEDAFLYIRMKVCTKEFETDTARALTIEEGDKMRVRRW